jgi:hypothetical protein
VADLKLLLPAALEAHLSETNSQLSTIKLGLALLFRPGQLVELRAKKTDENWRGFYYNDHEKLAETVLRLDNDPRVAALYYVINPVRPDIPKQRGVTVNPNAEQVDAIVDGPTQSLTRNPDIDTLNWLFVDVDTTRAPHLKDTDKKAFDDIQHECSTNEEKAATKQVAVQVLEYLAEKGWPQPLLGDSGNGYHLQFLLNMMNSDHNIHMLVDCLKALAKKFDCAVADIDCAVFNAARLTRAYGSTTRKGTNTAERPYRQNKLYAPKQLVGEVSLDQILILGSEIPMKDRRQSDDVPELVDGFDAEAWIKWYEDQGAFTIDGTRETNGMTVMVTDTCLTAGHKHTGSGLTGFIIGDTFGWHCFSDDCEGCTIGTVFKILREAVDDNGQPKFKPYPKQVFRDEGLETIKEGLEDGWIVEAKDEEERLDEEEKAIIEEELTVKPEPEPGKEPAANERKPDDIDKFCDKLTDSLISVMLHHPTEVYLDGFIHYIRRLKDKLGMNNPPSKRKAGRGEVTEVTIGLPFGETLMTIIKFVDAHKHLPDKAALKNYIEINDAMRKNQFRDEMLAYIDTVQDLPASTFDEIMARLLQILDVRFEYKALRAALPILKDDWNVQEFRSTLRRNQNKSTVQDSTFSQGAWQEKTEEIAARFERKLKGTDDSRKFKTGFRTIDNSGMNIGLDGNRAICFCGPSNNRKTTAVLSLALNFAINNKNILFFAGEHQSTKILDKLTLQLSHFYKDDEDIGVIPGLSAWEGLKVTATDEDLAKIKKLLLKLKAGDVVPGYIEPQYIDTIAQGEENKIDALLSYAESTFTKYQWDCIIIDPIDSCMPTESVTGRANTFQLKADSILKLFNFSRYAFGGRGCMVVITAQFGSNAVRDIQRIQEKNTGAERFDDEIEAILRRDGNIHSLTTIVEKFDLCIGVATLQKNGEDGIMVRGRDREGGRDWVLEFHVDSNSNYMTEKPKTYTKLTADEAAAAPAVIELVGDVL